MSSLFLKARATMLSAGVRSDSKMFALPLPAFDAFCENVFTERTDPKVALAQLAESGVSRDALPSLSAFYQWRRDFEPYRHAVGRIKSAAFATEVAEEASRSPVEWQRAIADQLAQMTFETMTDPNRDPETVKNLVTSVLNFGKLDVDREKLAQAERKLKLVEDAASQAKAELTKVAERGGLTVETREQIQKALSLL